MTAWLFNGDIIITEWADSMLRALWQGSMVFGLICIITTTFSKIQPTVHCWLWRIVYLKLLVSFLVVPFRIPHFTPLKLFPVPMTRFLNADPVFQFISTIPITSHLNSASPPLLLRPEFWFALWLLGIGWFGLRLVFLWHRNRMVRKDIRPYIPDEIMKSRYLDFCFKLKIQKPPRLLLSDSIDSPVLHGLLHPQIILPDTIVSQYSPDEIQAMLAHELAHFKRRDLFWNWLPLIVRGLFFFYPLVWLAERQWRNWHEICCDHGALRMTQVEAADYGKVLLKTTIMQPRIKLGSEIPRLAVFYTSQSKQVLKKRLLALERYSMNPKGILISFLTVAFAGFAMILPWKLTPPINIGITHYKTISYDYSNVINSMEVYVEFPFNNIDIKKINVVINNQKSEGTLNPVGGNSAYSSYPSITIPYKRRDPRKIKFLIQTNAGDFQEKYVVDFGRNYSNLEEFFLTF